jgi:hypothetical protein
LIQIITEFGELFWIINSDKTAFMGIAALNIDGYTMDSFLDVPLEMNKGSWTTKIIKLWDADCLQRFKQK